MLTLGEVGRGLGGSHPAPFSWVAGLIFGESVTTVMGESARSLTVHSSDRA
ncbi:hypothetical protein PN477_09550 [Spirulina subsalsa CS-330]|uniref:hypothetical protein n=1 Tax=Spirulina TaxID=1154 RepID=UPI00232E8C04|nr:hypothetical protein [Spirulina subsalsa]MDB9494862.1 hypothetical protein [Spirulina subsalsa CS-330]